jgi:hypothetical protein
LKNDIQIMKIEIPTENQEKELWRLYRFYWKEAHRCEAAKAYLAGCVMLGSALENLLILMISAHSEEIEKIETYPKKQNQPKPLLSWTLVELLKAAKDANWLPHHLQPGEKWNSRKAKIGDYAEVVRMVRNLLHPARYLKDHQKSKITNKYLQRQFEVVLACRNWLLAHNNEVLMKTMEAKDKKGGEK